MSQVHAFFMHTFFLFFPILNLCLSLSLSLSLSLTQTDCVMAPKQRKSTPARNLLQGAGSSSSDSPVPLDIRFRDEKVKTDFFENFQFNRNTRLFCQTLLTLIYPKSFGLEVGNFYLRDPQGVPSCLFRSFNLTYMTLIPLCLSLLLYSKVHVL